jgi:hypothetical protein
MHDVYGYIQDDLYETCPFISTNALLYHLMHQLRSASLVLNGDNDFKAGLGTLFLHDLWMQRLT